MADGVHKCPLPENLHNFIDDPEPEVPADAADPMRARWAIIDAEEIKLDLAWSYFAPLLKKHGFLLSDRKGIIGARRSAIWPPAANPFDPQPKESFVGYSVVSTPHSYSMWCYLSNSVHRGMDLDERDVWFKLYPPYHPNSQELRIWQHLNSKEQRKDSRNHTVPLLDSIQAGDWTLLVTPAWGACAADTHRAHLGELLDMGAQLMEGLWFMHEQGIVHRDISLSNVRFNHDRPIFLYQALDLTMFKPAYGYIDFENSEWLPGGPGTGQTVTGCIGTALCMAPEVKHYDTTQVPYDPFPADVYALAKVLKEGLLLDITNYPIALVQNDPDFPFDHGRTALAICSHVPEYLDLLDAMTVRDPMSRPTAESATQTMRQIIANLSPEILALPTPLDRPDLVNSNRLVTKRYTLQEARAQPWRTLITPKGSQV